MIDLRLVAVSGGHHPGAGDQGASTEVVANIQRHHVGHRVLPALVAANDLVVLKGSSICKPECKTFKTLLNIIQE